jgi:beta-glucosidase
VHDPVAALEAGTDLLKPASMSALSAAVGSGALPVSLIDADVQNLISHMFAYGLIGRALQGIPGTPVDRADHAAAALQTAERSVVLLRNRGGTLPLRTGRLHSVAVIGAAAYGSPVTAGFGSSHVIAPFVSTPLAAIKARLGRRVEIRYVDGGSTTRPLPPIPGADLSPASGRGRGMTLTIGHLAGSSTVLSVTDPFAAASVRTEAPTRKRPDVIKDNPLAVRKPGRLATSGDQPSVVASSRGTQITLPLQWGRATVTGTATFTVPRSGLYSISLSGSGSAHLSLDGRQVVGDGVTHGPGTWSEASYLIAGHHYRLQLDWLPLNNGDGGKSTLAVGLGYEEDALRAAAAAARRAQVAMVFAADYSGETFDRPSLGLPGDQDALIRAVAAANPHTVVVLDTSGPVLMPWLNHVEAVIEAWYPGEEDGAAIAAVLAGDYDPSGHLPVTFPASEATAAVSSPSQWPGTGFVSSYSEGLDVGYRYNHQTGTRPLFPFGFGLSYTTFSFRHLSISPGPQGVDLSATVTNTGRSSGGDAIQAYVTYPAAAGEPPGQLVAFRFVVLRPGAAVRVTLHIPRSELRTYQNGGWGVVPGRYTIGVGDSSTSWPLQGAFEYR